ncbi:MAG: trypsin-like peptidase domain-containing protein [Chloroflexi bacterium]|nr:trypsin-like peptidase domain-containing protein [Chloroflexota bacterium]
MRRRLNLLWLSLIIGLIVLVVGVMPSAAQTGPWTCALVDDQGGLNVRSGPGTTYPVLVILEPGAQIEVDESRVRQADGYSWLPVRLTGEEGWTILSRLAQCPAPAATPLPMPTNTSVPAAQTLIDQNGSLDRFEIAAIARSVVLLAGLDTDYYATGTGTITTSDGLIVTNAHVVEGNQFMAVGVLDDINDPPSYRYVGEVVSIDDSIDVALVAIRADAQGRPLDTAGLNLPFMPNTLNSSDVFRGDEVYIFGYPGIGDDYLVVTTGSIVSVENGDVDGQRLPVWYRTDAEIAPGNSGGLVVNGNGEFVGIPTFVQTESETGGRLGGIRPAEVALMAVMADYIPTQASAPAAPVNPLVSFEFDSVQVEHGAAAGGETGISFHLAFMISGWEQQPATVYARFYYDDLSSAPLTNATAPSQYLDKDHNILTSEPLLPCCPDTVYEDLPLFIPYSALGFTRPGAYPLKVALEVAADDGSWRHILSWEFITYTLR